MDIILHNIKQSQLPLLQELAKVLGVSIEKKEVSLGGLVQEDNTAFNAGMEHRFDEIETGKVKGHSWDEVKAAARKK